MTVSWDQVRFIDRNGPIVLYEVLYVPFDSFDGQLIQNALNVTHPNVEVDLENLEEFLEYNISVRAYTNAGPGPYSDPISNVTLPDCKLKLFHWVLFNLHFSKYLKMLFAVWKSIIALVIIMYNYIIMYVRY